MTKHLMPLDLCAEVKTLIIVRSLLKRRFHLSDSKYLSWHRLTSLVAWLFAGFCEPVVSLVNCSLIVACCAEWKLSLCSSDLRARLSGSINNHKSLCWWEAEVADVSVVTNDGEARR